MHAGRVIVGIGVDVVEVARLARALQRTPSLGARLFTDDERSRPVESLAARFAAKEAAFKALAGDDLARTIGWREIEVVIEGDGRPTLVLHGAAERRASALGVRRALVSLTHSEEVAGAVVVLDGD